VLSGFVQCLDTHCGLYCPLSLVPDSVGPSKLFKLPEIVSRLSFLGGFTVYILLSVFSYVHSLVFFLYLPSPITYLFRDPIVVVRLEVTPIGI